MAECVSCGKHTTHGRIVARASRRALKRYVHGKSPRTFKPNLQTVRIDAGGGTTKKASACASCIKAGKVARA